MTLLSSKEANKLSKVAKGLRHQLGAGSPTSFWVSWRESQCRNRLSNFNFEHGNLLGVLWSPKEAPDSFIL